MFLEERQREIAAAILAEGNITVAEIAARYGISDESARRDLRMLEQKGICKRTHGGAIVPPQAGAMPPAGRSFHDMPVLDTYREIARIAAGLIRENDSIFLTGGSFGHIILPFLSREIHYTLVVSSVETAKELREFDNVSIYVTGGKMRPSGSLVDSLASEFVSRLHFDLCFLTGSGLTADFGLSNGTDETAAFQRIVIRNSRKRCLLMPGVKIGVDSFIRVCDAASFDLVITDWDCPREEITALTELGIQVIAAEEPR